MKNQISVMETLNVAATVSAMAAIESARHPQLRHRITGITAEAAESLAALDEADRLLVARHIRPHVPGGGSRSARWWRRITQRLTKGAASDGAVPGAAQADATQALHALAAVAMYADLSILAIAIHRGAGSRVEHRLDAPTRQFVASITDLERMALAYRLAERHVGVPWGKPLGWWRDQVTAARLRFRLAHGNPTPYRPSTTELMSLI